MRWCIYGAGAIGGVLAARLAGIGEDVALIARGEHLEAIRTSGLSVTDPEGTRTIRLPAAESVADLPLDDGDVIVLTTKTHQTAAALDDISRFAPTGVRILCLQNGIDNERQALRFFGHVYGGAVTLLASYLEPGKVVAHSAPVVGILQIGRVPDGTDEFVERVASTLRAAGARVDVTDDIMRYKRLKLLRNLGNATEIICSGPAPEVVARATAEAAAVFRVAGLSLPDEGENIPGPEPVHETVPRSGGSTLQSVLRGTGTVETDYLNGEITLIGRLHGVPTPVNALLQTLAREVATRGRESGALDQDDVLRLL